MCRDMRGVERHAGKIRHCFNFAGLYDQLAPHIFSADAGQARQARARSVSVRRRTDDRTA